MIKFSRFLISLVICLICISCTGQNERTYSETILPQDTTMLWIGSGEITRDTVLIVGEGGPKNVLDFQSNGRVYWEYLEYPQNYYYAVVHQSSTINPSIFEATDFKLKQALKEVDNSSEILYRTIQYFKNRNKYVVVFGHSYSAWIIPHYLSTRPSLADKYIITGGRLDADSTQTSYQLKGLNTGFEEDGTTLILPEKDKSPNPNRTDRYWKIRKVKELLKYAIGLPRYTHELKDKNLSHLHFYYSKYDENVGALSPKEIAFLKSKNAEVIGFETTHYKIWQRVIDKFREGTLKL